MYYKVIGQNDKGLPIPATPVYIVGQNGSNPSEPIDPLDGFTRTDLELIPYYVDIPNTDTGEPEQRHQYAVYQIELAPHDKLEMKASCNIVIKSPEQDSMPVSIFTYVPTLYQVFPDPGNWSPKYIMEYGVLGQEHAYVNSDYYIQNISAGLTTLFQEAVSISPYASMSQMEILPSGNWAFELWVNEGTNMPITDGYIDSGTLSIYIKNGKINRLPNVIE